MREHPIPQDITGYRFHIIGSMTLKQFVELAAGVVLAVIFYSTNLPAAIKWVLILLSVGAGGLIAFVPIEERPLDHWIITFFKAMYRPTQFFWRREPFIPEVFNYTQKTLTNEPEEFQVNLAPVKRERIREYLTSVPNTTNPYSFDTDEVSRMNAILGSFAATPTPVVGTPTPASLEKPHLGVRVRNFRPAHQEQVVYTAPDQAGQPTDLTNQAAPGVNQELTDAYEQRTQLAKQQRQVSEVAQEVAIPETQLIHATDPAALENQDASTHTNDLAAANGMSFLENQQTIVAPISQAPAQEAAFNSNLPFPDPPTEPNKVVGMVLTPENELITGAIVEITKSDGSVARAVKTNALGQFFVTTALENGDYTLSVEKDGLTFAPMAIHIENTLLQPIEIRSVS